MRLLAFTPQSSMASQAIRLERCPADNYNRQHGLRLSTPTGHSGLPLLRRLGQPHRGNRGGSDDQVENVLVVDDGVGRGGLVHRLVALKFENLEKATMTQDWFNGCICGLSVMMVPAAWKGGG